MFTNSKEAYRIIKERLNIETRSIIKCIEGINNIIFLKYEKASL